MFDSSDYRSEAIISWLIRMEQVELLYDNLLKTKHVTTITVDQLDNKKAEEKNTVDVIKKCYGPKPPFSDLQLETMHEHPSLFKYDDVRKAIQGTGYQATQVIDISRNCLAIFE